VKAFISVASRGNGLPFMLRSMQPLMRSSTVLIWSSRPRYCGNIAVTPTQGIANGLAPPASRHEVQARLLSAKRLSGFFTSGPMKAKVRTLSSRPRNTRARQGPSGRLSICGTARLTRLTVGVGSTAHGVDVTNSARLPMIAVFGLLIRALDSKPKQASPAATCAEQFLGALAAVPQALQTFYRSAPGRCRLCVAERSERSEQSAASVGP